MSTMSAAQPLPPALAISIVLHAAVFAVAIFAGAQRAASVQVSTDDQHGSSWAGETLEVDGLVGSPSEPTKPEELPPAPESEPPKPPEASESVVKRAEKPRRKDPAPATSEPKPAQTDTKPTGAEARPASSGEGASESSQAMGTSGANSGTPSLGKAFTKALSAAAHRDPIWDELPLGEAGSVRVTITTDDEGKITKSEIDDEANVKTHFVRLVRNTVLRLGAGQFALAKGAVTAGTETLKIDVRLETGEADPDADDPRHTTFIGFEPPSASKAGRSYFTHASGRSFEAKVTLERGR